MYTYDPNSVLPAEEIENIAKEMISYCNSEAYVFINQPGLTPNDFEFYRSEMKSFYNYVFSSSTAIAFEKVSLPSHDIFESLINYAINTCRLDERIDISGNNTDSYEPYIDTSSRAIRLDFPPLPGENELTEHGKNRAETLKDYDVFIRYVLGHIPTPRQTIFYLSLDDVISRDRAELVESRIWPEIFQDVSRSEDIEKNNRIKYEEPFSATYRPKFDTSKYVYISALDSTFIESNRGLLRMITGSVLVYFCYQIITVVFQKIRLRTDKIVLKKKNE